MQIHFKFPDATALSSAGLATSDLRPATSGHDDDDADDGDVALVHTYIYMYVHTYLLTYLLTCCLALCQDAVVVRKCRHLYYYNYYVDVHGFPL